MTVNQVLSVLKEYDGVIGAVLGTVLGSISTLLVTHWLKNVGQVSLKLKEYDIQYYKSDDYGGRSPIDMLEEADYADLQFEIDIYNSAENVKTINDINFQLIDDTNAVIHTGKFNDIETGRMSAGAYRYDSLSFLNCKPKELAKKELKICFSSSDILLLKITKKIVIEAKLEGNTFPFKKRLKTTVTL
ncbi:hypothetical protein J7I80_14635 [Bacillus sp. ISL-41]|uniref:hypothetical protein n=1 Tax=unclassified Bacillus (in: firmicutes) TaxID=185979 RepID=UPI001BE90361|nr:MULTISPECIES: hypothetical protein [unclassified Bacillus (in: firmicutes)]MBT2640065.1 hypothetical protein [Bacillus sp. ISL-39]MBT2643476.1 hypothetical protein [Bacillus sp. ISL-41]